MDLDNRKKAILQAIITDYIMTAEPVGSRTISKKYKTGLSSATIRNEMSDLEELGFLEQPHTSAGRIPSDKGYRLYVDELMEIQYPSVDEIQVIKHLMELATINEIDKILKRTTKLLSDITNYTSAMLTPSVKKSTLKSLQLIMATSHDIVAIIVTDTGIIKNVVIKLPKAIDYDTLYKINNILSNKLCNLTIEEINLSVISSIQHELSGYTEILNAIIPMLHESLLDQEYDLYLEGTSNIFRYPEYNNIDKAKSFLTLVDQKDTIIDLFSDNKSKISVCIGTENTCDEVKDCSIVKASYTVNNKNMGQVGIIGPKRMDYSKVFGVLKCLADSLNDILNMKDNET